MTVKQLNETLAQLVSLLNAAAAKQATIKGLTEFIEATAAFGDLKLKEFVKLAEIGRTPNGGKPAPAPRLRAATKQAVDTQSIIISLKSLYEHAAEPSVTEEQIRAECDRLGALKKDDLARLSEAIGLSGMKSKKNGEIIAGITSRVLDRKGAAVRRQLIDRPQVGSENNPAGVA